VVGGAATDGRPPARRWRERSEALAPWTLAGAVVLYVALALYLARGASFTADELVYFGESVGLSPRALFDPLAGHLTAVNRLIFELNLRLFGPEHLPFQLVTIAGPAASSALLFILLRRWVGPLVALAAALVVLFFGTVPSSLQGNAMMWSHATAFGLAGLLAYGHPRPWARLLACAMLVLAVLSLEIGLAFALGIAAWAIAEGRLRRLWIAAVPIAVYAAWWLWALQFDEGVLTASNVLLVPAFTVELLASAAASLAGVGIDLTEPGLALVDPSWGPPALLAALVAVAVAIRRRGLSPPLWAALAFLAALCLSLAMAYGPLRVPNATRYLFPVAIGILLVLAAAYRGARPSRNALIAIAALTVIGLGSNLWLLGERGTALREASAETRARLAMIELERELVPPGFTFSFQVPVGAAKYLRAVDRFGSPAVGVEELAGEPVAAREAADQTLAAIVMPKLGPADDAERCREPASAEVVVPEGGAVLRSPAGGTLRLRRFAPEPTIEAGILLPDAEASIELPVDAAAEPWLASIEGGGELAVCPARE
jgi:hypothetical protein